MNPDTEFKLKKVLIAFSMLIGASALTIGASLYFIGFHNHDLGLNFVIMEEKVNNLLWKQGIELEFKDRGMDFITGARVVNEPHDMILDGDYQRNIGMVIMLLGALLIGVTFSDIGHLEKKEENPWKEIGRLGEAG